MTKQEKIQELLAKWKDAKRLMRDGLTMAQALRMLAGGDVDSLAPAGGRFAYARSDEVQPVPIPNKITSVVTEICFTIPIAPKTSCHSR